MATYCVDQNSPWSTIEAWQKFLNKQIESKLDIDGVWGNKTIQATKNWQEKNHLTADGKMGPKSCKIAHEQGFNIPPVPHVPGTVNAVIDISHYQEKVNFKKVKDFGITAVIQKAIEGIGLKDKTYDRNRREAMKEGLLWSAYQFLRGGDGAKQAKAFWEYAKPDGNTVLALDYEAADVSIGIAVDFVNWIVVKSGKYPMIYGGDELRRHIRAATREQRAILNRCPLWLSQYSRPDKVRLPMGWNKYTIWQYTGNGRVDGINGACDQNLFQGSKKELNTFWKTHAV